MSLVLALDSARRRGGAVALAEGGDLLSLVEHDPSGGYAEAFFGLADEVLARAGVDRDAVEEVAVVAGPGSFTGLRIGVMTAKSLAFARGWRLRAAGSLEVLASRVDPGRRALALMDAGRDALYAAVLRPGPEGLDVEMPPRRCTPEQLRAALDAGGDRVLVPDGEEVLARLEGDLDFLAGLPRLDPEPLAAALARGASAGAAWCPVVDPVGLLPVYLGASQAERVHGLDLGEEVHRPRPPRPPEER